MLAEIELNPKYSNTELIEKFWLLPKMWGCPIREYEILPDGYFDIVFGLSETRRRIFLAGPYTGKSVVQNLPGEVELFAARFRLGCVPELVDSTPSDLVNAMVPLDRLFGMAAEDLGEMLWQQKGIVAKQELLDTLLQQHQPRLMPLSKVFHRAVSIIEAENGQTTVQNTADTLGITMRTLERHFLATLEMTPKQFLRVVRFKKAVQQLRAIDTGATLTDIAMKCGYYDQSHFVRDFKAFYGESPLAYCKQISSVD